MPNDITNKQNFEAGLSMSGGAALLGTSTEPTQGAGMLKLSGASSASDRDTAPDVVAYVSDSDYPCFHLQPYNYNNISMTFGAHNTGSSWISGRSGSGASIWYSDYNDYLAIRVFSGETEGANINSSFTDSMYWDLSSGDVTAKQGMTVEGDLSVNTVEGESISDTQWGYLGSTNQGLATTDNVTFGDIKGKGGLSVNKFNSALDLSNAVTTKENALTIWSGDATPLNEPAIMGLVSGNNPGITTSQSFIDMVGSKSTIAQLSGGTYTAVANNNVLGQINFIGDDGTDIRTIGGYIAGRVNTTNESVSANTIPTDILISSNEKADIVLSTDGSDRVTVDHLGNVGINETLPLNQLDVSGNLGIGSAVAGIETAPTNGLLVQGDFDFHGTGSHQIRFPDPVNEDIGRSGIQQRDYASDQDLYIWNSATNYGINLYNNQGWLKHTGWNGSYNTTVFKSKSDTGDHVIAANTAFLEDEEFVANKTGSGRNFGSVMPRIDETPSNEKFQFKVRLTNESGKTITGITQANPAVVTATAHGYSNGDKVEILQVGGMTELNRNMYTVANKTTNTFELSGVDSSSYTAYTSGGTSNKTRFGIAELAITLT